MTKGYVYSEGLELGLVVRSKWLDVRVGKVAQTPTGVKLQRSVLPPGLLTCLYPIKGMHSIISDTSAGTTTFPIVHKCQALILRFTHD